MTYDDIERCTQSRADVLALCAEVERLTEELKGAHDRLDDYGIPRTSDEAAGLGHALQWRILELHERLTAELSLVRAHLELYQAGKAIARER